MPRMPNSQGLKVSGALFAALKRNMNATKAASGMKHP